MRMPIGINQTLEIENITKNFGKKQALSSLSMRFNTGVNAILGPNGAGKSTLMGLITDTVDRDQGSIKYNDIDILTLGRDFRKKLGFMPQVQCFYEQMTPTEFLTYMAKMKGIEKILFHNQIPELLNVVELYDAAHRPIKTLSGGMRQRVLLAQALLGDPEVLILDEPTAGLDPEERVHLRDYIGQLGEKRIVLITTHIASDVEKIAQKVMILKEGKLLFWGSNKELFQLTDKDCIEDAYITLMHMGKQK